MPASFQLNWDNTAILSSGNTTSQIAAYRKKLTGGAFIITGFTPPNNMAKAVNSALTDAIGDYNSIYEFKVDAICAVNGPIINSNGIREQIAFFCLVPTFTTTDVKSTIVLNIASLNITKARFTLRKQSDNTIVYGPIIVNPVGSIITAESGVLLPTTIYIWQTELYSVINGVEVVSSAVGYLNAVCSNEITTLATVACPAPNTLIVTN